ncbi:DUF5660 domain-containing protein [Patescibacteria group bacterium]|nr:DUF5660 domain-containing protein [Patescibacteria group bacterium]MCL5091885.1 DUF5660 domain-containing protein [Patescibacteria group bacterium]
MQTKTGMKTNAQQSKKNPVETLKDFGGSVAKNTATAFKDLGMGIFDQMLGNYEDDTDRDLQLEEESAHRNEKKPHLPQRKEFTLFNYQEYYESRVVKRKIKELTELIHKEIALLKKADRSLLNDVRDIENLAINSLPENPGIYHVRFLEIVLSILQNLRAKVGESRTWLKALVSKKKKRGSLFAAISKKKGTQYSMSQELSTARSIQ